MSTVTELNSVNTTYSKTTNIINISADFLAQLFTDTEHDIETRCLPSREQFFSRNIADIQKFISQKSQSQNVYFGCCTRAGEKGTKDACREVVALWCDIDFKDFPGGQSEVDTLIGHMIPPSVIVCSGNGYHIYWLLREPVGAQVEIIEPYLKGLASHYKGDMAAAEVARVLRVPGTFNYKDGNKKPVTLIKADYNLRYNLSDFDDLRDESKSLYTRQPQASHDTDSIPEGQRNSTLTSLAGTMRKRGMSEDEIVAAIHVVNSNRCRPPLPDNEVDSIVKSVCRYAPGSQQGKTQDQESEGTEEKDFRNTFLSLSDFLKMEIPERSRLLPFLPEGGLMMIYGPRGLGKTYAGIGLTISLICNEPFLKWKVNGPAGVLYLDGEMSLHDLRERFLSLLQGEPKAPVYFLSHEYFYQKIEKDLNLANMNIQEAVKHFIEAQPEIRVVVFDNLSCLLPGVKEDKRDDWTLQVLPFLLWLRRRGVAVILIHHSGKSGEQRGTSSREDALDTVIRLDKIPNAKNEGAQFIIRFVKSRGAYGDDVNDIECRLDTINGVPTWTWKPLEESTEDRLLKFVAEGIDNVSDMAEELGVSKGLVSRIKRKLQTDGRLSPGKELRQP